MTATDELRHLLDERGVEWRETVNHVNCVFTWWESPTFGMVHAMDNEDGETLFMACLNNCDFTPEQAIAATLGGGECEDRAEAFTLLTNGTICVGSKQLVARIAELQSRLNNVALGGGKLTAEQVRECVERVYLEGYSDGSVNRGAHIEETDWQAIADELNATLGHSLNNPSMSETLSERGTCHDKGGTDENGQQVFDCDACGCVLSLYDRDGTNTLCTGFIYDYPRYCPACGARVVNE